MRSAPFRWSVGVLFSAALFVSAAHATPQQELEWAEEALARGELNSARATLSRALSAYPLSQFPQYEQALCRAAAELALVEAKANAEHEAYAIVKRLGAVAEKHNFAATPQACLALAELLLAGRPEELMPVAGRDKRRELALAVLDHLPLFSPATVRDVALQGRICELLQRWNLSKEAVGIGFRAFCLCPYETEAVRQAAELVSEQMFLRAVSPSAAQPFFEFQQTGKRTEGVPELPGLRLGGEAKQALLAAAGQYPRYRTDILLYVSRYEKAIEALCGEYGQAQTDALRAANVHEIARCLKARDGNLLLANRLVVYASRGVRGGKVAVVPGSPKCTLDLARLRSKAALRVAAMPVARLPAGLRVGRQSEPSRLVAPVLAQELMAIARAAAASGNESMLPSSVAIGEIVSAKRKELGLAALENALFRSTPEVSEASALIARYRLELGDLRKLWESITRSRPGSRTEQAARALVACLGGDRFAESEAIDRADAQDKLFLVEVLTLAGSLSKAGALLSEVIAAQQEASGQPSLPILWRVLDLGMSLRTAGELREAISWLERGLALARNEEGGYNREFVRPVADLLLHLAMLKSSVGEHEAAQTLLEQAAQVDAGGLFASVALSLRYADLLREGRTAEYRAHFLPIDKWDPGRARSRAAIEVARSFAREGDVGKAQEWISKAAEELRKRGLAAEARVLLRIDREAVLNEWGDK